MSLTPCRWVYMNVLTGRYQLEDPDPTSGGSHIPFLDSGGRRRYLSAQGDWVMAPDALHVSAAPALCWPGCWRRCRCCFGLC